MQPPDVRSDRPRCGGFRQVGTPLARLRDERGAPARLLQRLVRC